MTTIADLCADVRDLAYGTQSEILNIVAAGGYTSGDTELVLDSPITGITPGTIVCSGLNVWYVRGVQASTKTLLVLPGINGAPGGNAAEGDFVVVRPKITDWALFKRLNAEIVRLSRPTNGLYRVGTWESVVNLTSQVYPLPADTNGRVVRVRYLVPGLTDNWEDLPPSSWSYDAANDQIQLSRDLAGTTTLQFVYLANFTPASALDDDITDDCGLEEDMRDIPVLGVCASMMLTSEARRTQVQVQGDTRRAVEVSVGANSAGSRYFKREWQDRVNDEAARLMNRLPIYRGIPGA